MPISPCASRRTGSESCKSDSVLNIMLSLGLQGARVPVAPRCLTCSYPMPLLDLVCMLGFRMWPWVPNRCPKAPRSSLSELHQSSGRNTSGARAAREGVQGQFWYCYDTLQNCRTWALFEPMFLMSGGRCQFACRSGDCRRK